MEALLNTFCDEIDAYRVQFTTFDADFYSSTGETWDTFISAIRHKVDSLKKVLCNWDSYHACMKLVDYEAYLACGALHKCVY
jgi:hypothetical protein